MVRLKHSTSEVEESDKVLLFVVGPKCIISESVAVETKLSNTWLKVLNDELKLGISSDQGLYVCCSGYCPTAPKNGQGWRSELTETVQDFINKFERKRNQYRVRICFSYDVSDNHVQPTNNLRTPRGRASTPANQRTPSRRGRSTDQSVTPVRQPNIVISTDRGNNAVMSSSSNDPSSSSSQQNDLNGHFSGTVQLAKRRKIQNYTEIHIQTDIPSVPGPHVFLNEETNHVTQMLKIENYRSVVKTECTSEYYDETEEDLEDESGYDDVEEPEGGNVGEQDERDENRQAEHEEYENNDFGELGDEEGNTGVCEDNLDDLEGNPEALELRQLGIQFRDLKSSADRRFTGLSNAYMLRVRNEMRNLMKDNEWIDVFQRSPLCFHFIQEMFK